MRPDRKTKAELADELRGLRARISELEAVAADRERELASLRENERLFHVAGGPVVALRRAAEMGWPVELISPGVMDVFGRSADDFLSRRVCYADIVHPADLARVQDELARHGETGADRVEQEYRIVRPDGELRWLRDSAVIARDADGRVTHYEGYVLDVTAARQADRALRFTQFSVHHSTEGICWVDREARILDANDAICNLLGYTREELCSLTILDFDPKRTPDGWPAFWEELKRRGSLTLEARLKRKRGTPVPVEVAVNYLEFENEEYQCAFVRDTSARKQAEAALQLSEVRYRALAENFPNGAICLFDRELRFIVVDGAVLSKVGLSREALVAKTIHEALPPETCVVLEPHFRAALKGQKRAFEMRFADLDLEVRCLPVRAGRGEVVSGMATAQDITERKRTEESLRFQAMLLDQIGDRITATDLDGRITYANAASARGTEWSREELVGRSVQAFGEDVARGATQREIVERTLADGEWRGEVINRERDGSEIVVDCRTWVMRDEAGNPTGLCGVSTDITERKQAEEERQRFEAQLQRAQKLESLGVLAAGIAHDFNNLLVGVMGYAGLAQAETASDSPAQLSLRRIEHAAQRAAELSSQMLAYSGKGQFVIGPVDLGELVKDMDDLLRASVSKKAVLRYEFSKDLRLIEGDADQIRQVIVNLVTNASEALNGQSGTITIRTGVAVLTDADRFEHYLEYDLPAGPLVFLEVEDTGSGMDAPTRARIFDPFFTTRFTGRGLGLAAVLGIVRGHRGAIRVQSTPGQGTTFRILFPARELARRLSTNDAAPTAQVAGTGTVLVVDDEETVRSLARSTLERAGYTVLTAEDGRAAVEVFRAHQDEIDAVLLDLTMPELDGDEAFRELHALRGNVPVIISSGSAEREAAERFAGDRPAGFMQKPYRPAELVARIHELLTRDK